MLPPSFLERPQGIRQVVIQGSSNIIDIYIYIIYIYIYLFYIYKYVYIYNTG